MLNALNGLQLFSKRSVTKTLRIMKLTTILMLVCCMQISAKSSSQNITLKVRDAPLTKVFQEIKKQTGYTFIYTESMLKEAKRVSIDVSNSTLQEVLMICFAGQPFSYQIINKTVVVEVKVVRSLPTTASSLAVAQAFLPSPPPIEIKGRVTDDRGVAVPGVSVLEKGTSNGVATNNEGNYSITVMNANSTLIFSSIGYTPKEVPVGNTRVINVTLMSGRDQGLEEVVILGYASQKKSDLTGSVSTVNANDIHDLPATSVAETLQGRVAGVQVVTGSGEPGAGSDIVIRGGGSVNGMPPLFIVDGVRMGTDFSFNNQDIASIEILKDASAAAIYGAQAAGGVVLISTKRGKGLNQKINVDVNSSYGIRKALRLPTLLDTKQFFTARGAFGTNVSAWGNPDELPNTDWMKELFRTGVDQNYGVSLSGASDNANYFVSGNYFRQDGVRTYNSFERFSLRINADFKLNKKITVGETVYLNKNYSDPIAFGGNYWRSVPSMAIKNADGTWGNAPVGGYYNGRNPIQQEASNHGGTSRHKIDGSLYADYKITDWLSARGTFGATLGSNVLSLYDEAFVTGSNSGPAVLTKTFTDRQDYTANFVVNFSKSFGLHDVKALAGYEVYKEDRNILTGNASEFAIDVTASFF